jgi:tRNA A37 methylthiotransferase MiaB
MTNLTGNGPDLTVGLVQINNSFADACYLPYSIGVLQAYFQEHSGKAAGVRFLTPVYRRTTVAQSAREMAGAQVLGLSVSSWNFKASLEIARLHKERHPESWIVLGGPHVPSDPGPIFSAYPWVDLVVHGEGEIPFTRILESWPQRDWEEIPSVSYLSRGILVSRPEESRITELDQVPSPYLAGVFEPLMSVDRGHQWLALWETNRGCPFTCSYCDWGAATRSKLFCFGMERLEQEIQWFSRQRIEFIFCCDSNFGIFPRDMEIVAAVARAKELTGYPRALSVQNTKDSDRSYQMQKTLAEAGLSKGVNLALQSMNPETLDLIGRRNIPAQMFQDLQHRYSRDRIETFSDIIIGLPGESYQSFTRGIDQIIEGGQHNRIQFINLSILPNAPMARPAYRDAHGLVSVETRIMNIHGAPADALDSVFETQELVVGSAAMPVEDWCRTRAFSWMASLVYFDKLLQIPIMLLRALGEIGYVRQIEAFLDPAPGQFPIFEELNAFFLAQARNIVEGGPEFFHAPDALNIFWPHDEYAYIRLSKEGKLEAFYREAGRLLGALAAQAGLGTPAWLAESLELNRMLLKQPGSHDELTLDCSWDLLATCEAVRTTGSGTLVEGPVSYRVDRGAETWPDWDSWSREVVWYANKRGAYLYPWTRQEHAASVPCRAAGGCR